jgi:type VI secretion system protein ImpC
VNPQEELATMPVAETAQATEVDLFAELLTRPVKDRNQKDKRAKEVQQALGTIAEWVLRDEKLIADDVFQTVKAVIAGLDQMLSAQVNAIMHHEDFQRLEATWRGLHYLVTHTETDETLKIRVLNLPKKDLAKTIRKYKGTAWDQSPLFKKIYEQEYGMPGGEPYGCLVGDYYFDHSTPDVEILAGVAQIAAAAHTPFIGAADPAVMGMESWRRLGDKRDLTQVFQTAMPPGGRCDNRKTPGIWA